MQSLNSERSSRRAVTSPPAPLHGIALWLATATLSMGCFAAVLDMTITNVALPSIAGSLAITPTQAIWTITSYAVAEGVSVTLMGWLAGRFGAVRVMTMATLLFGASSLLCGLANSFEVLVLGRILQGCTGGLMYTGSQTLVLRIFPRDKAGLAIGVWSMPGLVGPILGPLVGGWLCETFSWPLIFFINVPIALGCAFLTHRLLKGFENVPAKVGTDFVGFALLVLFVGAMQIIVDIGKHSDWFESSTIRALGAVGVVAFAAFLIWELTDKHPIVDLRVFRHRIYSTNSIVYMLAHGAAFSTMVLTPLWLQTHMGYSATMAGITMAWNGALAAAIAPLVGTLMSRTDPRLIGCLGTLWCAITMWLRSHYSTDVDNWQIVLPLLMMGAGLPLVFVPFITIGIHSVDSAEVSSAAGLQNFMRTIASALAASIATTMWDYKTMEAREGLSQFVGRAPDDATANLMAAGQGVYYLDAMVQNQSAMIGLNQIMLGIGALFALCAVMVWLVPRASDARRIPASS